MPESPMITRREKPILEEDESKIDIISHYKEKLSSPKERALKYLRNFIPPPFEKDSWARTYTWAQLRGDFVAGLTVGVMLIPQGLAYGQLAGVPPIYGLYSAIFPPIIYALFGTSRQLQLGPVALTALLNNSAVLSLGISGAPEASKDFVAASSVFAFYTGLVWIFMSIFRLGVVVNFLSNSVLSGFMTAAAIIIAFSQIKDVLSVSLQSTETFIATIKSITLALPESSWVSVLCSIGAILILYFLNNKMISRWPKWLPTELLVMVIGIILVLSGVPLKTVGHVPAGLSQIFAVPPVFSLPLDKVLPKSVVIAVISFIGSIALVKSFSIKHNYPIDANKEFSAMGAASLLSSFASAHPVAGSFSRTAVNDSMGATSPLAGVITSAIAAIFVMTLTVIFRFLPRFTLAAIVLMSVRGLIDYPHAIYLWKIKHYDELVVWVCSLLFTLLIGIETGVILAIGVSLVVLIVRSADPGVVLLGKSRSGIYRNLKRYPNAETYPGLLIFRINSDLYFANVEKFKESIFEYLNATKDPIHYILVNFESVNYVDSNGLQSLEKVVDDLKNMKIRMAITNSHWQVRESLGISGLNNKLFLDPHNQLPQAVDTARRMIAEKAYEQEEEEEQGEALYELADRVVPLDLEEDNNRNEEV